MIAFWEIGAPDGSRKEHIAHEGQTILGVHKHDMARRMPRTMQDLQGLLTHRDRIAVLQPPIRYKARRARHAEHRALSGQLGNPEFIVGVWPLDRDAESLGEKAGLPAMINVTVREQDFLDLHPPLIHDGLQAIEIATRINQRGALGLRAHH